MKKKMLSMILAAAMAVSLLAGCGASGSGSSDSGKDNAAASKENSAVDKMEGTNVVVGISADPTSLAPWLSNNGGRIGIMPSVYETLVQTEGLGTEMYGVLAESWEQVDDVTYNVKIYDYIYDTAGNHMTAADVAFSYNTAKEQGNLNKLSQIKEVKAIDDYTAQFVMNEKLNDGQLETLWTEAVVVTQAAYEASEDGMATIPVTTAPYKVTEYVAGSKVIAVKNEDYWQTDETKIRQMSKQNVDNVEFDIITDMSQMANALKTGSIDMTNTVDAIDLPAFKDGGEYADGFTAFQVEANNTYMLQFNCDPQSPCGNVNLRKAIMYAINKDQIVDTVLGGDGFAVHGYGNKKFGDYNPEWDKQEYFDYDIEKAKEYLAKFEEETGLKASDITLTLINKEASRPNDNDVMQIIQGYLLAIGVNSEISVQSANNYVKFASDPTAWDVTMASENAASTNYLITWWENQMNPAYYPESGTFNFIKDDKLTELINIAKTPEGHTTENMDALQQYLNDNAYVYGICGYFENVVAADFVTDLCTECRVQIIPGGCEYDWNAKAE